MNPHFEKLDETAREEIQGELLWTSPGEAGQWTGLEHPLQTMATEDYNVEQYSYDRDVVYQYPPGEFWQLSARMGHDGEREVISHERVYPYEVTTTKYRTTP